MGKERDDEIDLAELFSLLWLRKGFIAKLTLSFCFFGLLIAFTSKVEYEARTKLLPESQESNIPDLGGLGGLAGLAGFDLSGLSLSGGVLTPELYPELAKNTLFLKELMDTPIYFEKRDTLLSSLTYLQNVDRPSLWGLIWDNTFGLPAKIMVNFSSQDSSALESYSLVRFNKEEWEMIEEYSERIFVSVDKKTGIIEMGAEMPDPVAAAMVTNILVSRLTENIVDYKIEKTKKNLDFIQEQFLEAKEEYELKQLQLAKFTHTNRNISNSMIQTEYKRLQNEMDISFEVYKSLASQLEQGKLKVKEETPVFTVLEPIRIPDSKSSPKRMIIVLVSFTLGIFLSIGIVLVKDFLPKT